MKGLLLSALLFYSLLPNQGFAQPEGGVDSTDVRNDIVKNDLSILWTTTNPNRVLGYIGNNYQRLQMALTSITKDPKNPEIYNVKGKSRVKNNICDFTGTIRIKNVYRAKTFNSGIDNKYVGQIKDQGVLIAEYSLQEDVLQVHSGIFSGYLTTYWYINTSNKLCYDDSRSGSDDFHNNQFQGFWEEDAAKNFKICNWGDYRIPDSNNLDIGAAEFSPSDKYLEYGWKDFREAHLGDPKELKTITAKKKEAEEWWK